MPLFRLLIIALIIGGIIYLYRRITNQRSVQKQHPEERSTSAVKCELCGLHVPEHEAVRRNNHIYCCQDHADKAARQ
jgi:uncharacterized protein